MSIHIPLVELTHTLLLPKRLVTLELKLCDIQGRLFELFANSEYDVESLVKAFINGEIEKNIDSEYNRMQWAGEEYLLEELIATCNEKLTAKRESFSKDVLFWMGYVYRCWHFYTNEENNRIYKQASFETMNVNYLIFHTWTWTWRLTT